MQSFIFAIKTDSHFSSFNFHWYDFLLYIYLFPCFFIKTQPSLMTYYETKVFCIYIHDMSEYNIKVIYQKAYSQKKYFFKNKFWTQIVSIAKRYSFIKNAKVLFLHFSPTIFVLYVLKDVFESSNSGHLVISHDEYSKLAF